MHELPSLEDGIRIRKWIIIKVLIVLILCFSSSKSRCDISSYLVTELTEEAFPPTNPHTELRMFRVLGQDEIRQSLDIRA